MQRKAKSRWRGRGGEGRGGKGRGGKGREEPRPDTDT